MFDERFKKRLFKSLIEYLIVLVIACLMRLFKLDEVYLSLLIVGYILIHFLLNGHKVVEDEITWAQMSKIQRIFDFSLVAILILIVNWIL